MKPANDDHPEGWRPEPGGDVAEAAIAHLRASGCVLMPAWRWAVPVSYTLTDCDLNALTYLNDECGFGGWMRADVPRR